MAQATWILLSWRLPREPSRLRLAIWRRLKRIGAVLLHDSVRIFPADAKTREDRRGARDRMNVKKAAS